MTTCRIESSHRSPGMRYARSNYVGSEGRPPFWRFMRNFARLPPLDLQARWGPCHPTIPSTLDRAGPHDRTNVQPYQRRLSDADLRTIRSEVIDMGDRVRKSVEASMTVLAHRDLDLPECQVEFDRVIDSRQREIETKVIETMACPDPS